MTGSCGINRWSLVNQVTNNLYMQKVFFNERWDFPIVKSEIVSLWLENFKVYL